MPIAQFYSKVLRSCLPVKNAVLGSKKQLKQMPNQSSKLVICIMEILSLRPSKIQNKKKVFQLGQKKVQWAIQGDDLKVLMLLSLIRKIIKRCKQLLRENQQLQVRKFKQVHALITQNMNNSFQIIEPVNQKVENIKLVLSAYNELKKNILGYLKLKKREYMKRTHMAVTLGFDKMEFNRVLLDKSQFQNKYEIKAVKFQNLLPKDPCLDDLPLLTKPIKVQSTSPGYEHKENIENIAQIQTSKKLQQNTRSEVCTLYKSCPFQDNKVEIEDRKTLFSSKKILNQNKTYYLPRKSLNKFVERKRNQINIFNRMNKTIEKCCENNQLTISIENFAIFTRNLSTLKASLSYNFHQIQDQKEEFQDRILSEIILLCSKLKDSIPIFYQIVQPHHQIADPLSKISLLDSIQGKPVSEPSILKQKLKKQIGFFSKFSAAMIQFIKNLSISPNFKSILYGKAKFIEKLIPIFTQIRYTSNYLTKEVENMDSLGKKFGKTAREDVKTCEKWRNAFIKKYRSNHTVKRLRF